MNGSTHMLATILAVLLGAQVASAETIPCINTEVLELDNNFRDGFHPGYIYEDFWGDEDKELVLVNAKDETWRLEVYTSANSVSLCAPDISIKLEITRHGADAWNHSATDNPILREYGFHLYLNDRKSIIFEEFWYSGTRGFEHSNGAFTLRLLDNEVMEWIGYDDGYVGLNYRGESRSINFLTGRYSVVSYPGVLQSEGEREERWGTFDATPIRLYNGDTFRNEQIEITKEIFDGQ